MPHVIVKLLPGRTEHLKTELAEAIAKAVMAVLNSQEKSVSVAIEEVEQKDWTEKVYKPDIQDNMDRIYKRPGYDPL